MGVLLNADLELRSGWKFVAYAIIFLIVYVAAALLVSAIYSQTALPRDELTVLALNSIVLLIPAATATSLMARFVDHRPLSAFGVGFNPRWRRHFLVGLGMAAVMLLTLAVASAILGRLSVEWAASMATPARLAITVGLLWIAAANEEMVFRGYPFQALIQGMGAWPAVLLMSAIFGALHMSNPNASAIGTANTLLAGVLLSIAYLRTRSLWLPYGIHVAWNVGIGFILGFPLSGLDIPSLWKTNAMGNDLILGGAYGPEGGLLATLIFAGTAISLHRGNFK